MITLNNNESKSISFDVSVQGVDVKDLHGALRMNINGMEYGFPITTTNESIQVNIPAPKTFLKESVDGSIDAKLEIVAGDTYIVPWEDNIKIVFPVVVEAKVKDQTTTKMLNVDVKGVVEKKESKSPSITTKPKPKSKFGTLLGSQE